MSAKRRKVMIVIAASFFLIGGASLVCCSRTTSPGVEAPPPRAETKPSEAKPSETPPQEAQAEPEKPAERQPPTEIDMRTPQQPAPELPRYVAVVDQYEAGQPGIVRANVVQPRKLELETTNVRKLRITREGLPLARDRSIALHIDGQGIEWTREYVAVELERSPAGVWEVVNRKPTKP